MPRRLVVLGLDGFEISLAESMMAAGELPHLPHLSQSSGVFDLSKTRACGLTS